MFVIDHLATWSIFHLKFVVLEMTGSVAYDPPFSIIPTLTALYREIDNHALSSYMKHKKPIGA